MIESENPYRPPADAPDERILASKSDQWKSRQLRRAAIAFVLVVSSAGFVMLTLWTAVVQLLWFAWAAWLGLVVLAVRIVLSDR